MPRAAAVFYGVRDTSTGCASRPPAGPRTVRAFTGSAQRERRRDACASSSSRARCCAGACSVPTSGLDRTVVIARPLGVRDWPAAGALRRGGLLPDRRAAAARSFAIRAESARVRRGARDEARRSRRLDDRDFEIVYAAGRPLARPRRRGRGRGSPITAPPFRVVRAASRTARSAASTARPCGRCTTARSASRAGPEVPGCCRGRTRTAACRVGTHRRAGSGSC
jgi:hypothetical protein